MKRWVEKGATMPEELKGGTRFEMKGGLAVPVRPPLIIEPPRQKVGKVTKLRIAKINPYRRLKAIITIDATMAAVRKAVGSKHVSTTLVCNIDDRFPIHVCCDAALSVGPIWSLVDGLPIRGSAILYTNFGPGPADFPTSVDATWLDEMIVWEPEGVTTAINDPVGDEAKPNFAALNVRMKAASAADDIVELVRIGREGGIPDDQILAFGRSRHERRLIESVLKKVGPNVPK